MGLPSGLLLGVLLMPMLAHGAMLYATGFESGSTSELSSAFTPESCCSGQLVVVKDASGGHVHRTTLQYGQTWGSGGTHRAEWAGRDGMPNGSEMWYRFRVKLVQWPHDNKYESLAQIMQNRGNWEGTSDLQIMQLMAVSGQWVWNLRGPNPKGFRVGSYQVGRWTSFVVHAKWSSGSDGFVEIWRDGRRVASHRGANFSAAVGGLMTFKFGVYKPNWDTHTNAYDTPRIAEHDDIKIGDGGESYASMTGGTPGNDTGEPQPTENPPPSEPPPVPPVVQLPPPPPVPKPPTPQPVKPPQIGASSGVGG